MAKRSDPIRLLCQDKLLKVNPDTLKLYEKYQIDMSIRDLALTSIDSYNNDLQNWFIYVLDHQFNACVTDLTDEDITEFLYFCKKQGNNSRRMKRRMASISAFYKFLRKKKHIVENPMEFMERPKKDTDVTVQTYFSKEQVQMIRERFSDPKELQTLLYALFSLSTMARVTAVSSIKWDQIDFDLRVVNEVLEKEGKIVTLYFSEEVRDLLLKLKAEREENGVICEYVFMVRTGQKADSGALYNWCKRIGEAIGVPTAHPHDFRHSGSQLLSVAGCPIEVISELLSHSGLDVTKKHYLIQDKKKMQSAKDKYAIV